MQAFRSRELSPPGGRGDGAEGKGRMVLSMRKTSCPYAGGIRRRRSSEMRNKVAFRRWLRFPATTTRE